MPIVVAADDVTTRVNAVRIVVVADAVAAEVRRAKVKFFLGVNAIP